MSDNPFVDDRDRQGTLDIGEASSRTEDRESSIMGSDSFADDRASASDSGEQFNLFAEEETIDGQASLGGGQATEETDGFFEDNPNGGSKSLFGVSEGGEPEPILSSDERHRAGMGFEDVFGPQTAPDGFDISLSPEEAFEGVGATSSRAIGGFNSTIGRETDRFDRERAPPGMIAREPRQVDPEIESSIAAADAAGVLSPEPNGDAQQAPEGLFGGSDSGGNGKEQVDVGGLGSATTVRDRFEEWLHPDDHRGRTTVQFSGDVPEGVLRQARAVRDETAAERSRSQSVSLTETERNQIKSVGGFSQSRTTANWRSAKGVFEREGLTSQFRDAIGSINDFDDPIEGAEAYVQRHKRRQADAGVGGVGGMDVGEEDIVDKQRAGRAAAREQQILEASAIEGAKRGHQEAVDALVLEAGWDRAEAEALGQQVKDPAKPLSEPEFQRIVDTEIKRARSSGRFAAAPTREGPPGVDRRRSSGRFVSSPLVDADIGRNSETGRFTRGDR